MVGADVLKLGVFLSPTEREIRIVRGRAPPQDYSPLQGERVAAMRRRVRGLLIGSGLSCGPAS